MTVTDGWNASEGRDRERRTWIPASEATTSTRAATRMPTATINQPSAPVSQNASSTAHRNTVPRARSSQGVVGSASARVRPSMARRGTNE